MDLFYHLKFAYTETFVRHAEEGRFITLRLIEDGESVLEASNAICDLVLRRLDNARGFLPALEWAVYEIIDNIRVHAQAFVPGAVCAQFFPERHRLDISICDMGRGIKASLEESMRLRSHGDAITKALQRGVTRNQEIGQGNGLAGSLEITRRNGGDFQWSGDVDYSLRDGEEEGFTQIPLVEGTGVLFRFDTRHPVDLRQTFIGESSWSYIDKEAERIQESGGLRVADECPHTGTRESAKALRRKIRSLLQDYEAPLVLDFQGVERTSSSFLDELLGRLAKELGESEFHKKLKLTNVSDLLLNMANVVIHQRLHGLR